MKKLNSLAVLVFVLAIAAESCGGGDSFFDIEIKDVELQQYYVGANASQSHHWDSIGFAIALDYIILSSSDDHNRVPNLFSTAMATDETIDYFTVLNPVEDFVLSTTESYNDSMGSNLSAWIDGEYLDEWKHERHYYDVRPFHFRLLAPPKQSGYYNFQLTTFLKTGEVIKSRLDSVLILK